MNPCGSLNSMETIAAVYIYVEGDSLSTVPVIYLHEEAERNEMGPLRL